MKIFSVILLAFLLSGCATKTRFYIYDRDTGILKEVGQVEQEAKGAASIEKDDTKMVVDTRQPTAWERFISPVFQGVTQGAKASVEAK